MIRKKRIDTKVGSVEVKYGIDLNARSDMLLGNLLRKRGFESQSQLLKAARGKQSAHQRRRRVFFSFHAEDYAQVQGLRLLAHSPHNNLDFRCKNFFTPIQSDRESVIKKHIERFLKRAEVLVCIVGNGTGWRDWVDWEINKAKEMGIGICAIRLENTRGRFPESLYGAIVSGASPSSIIAAIEHAAARRS